MNKILQILAGHRQVKHPIPKSYSQHNEQLETMVFNYQAYKDDNDLIAFLRGVALVTTWDGTQLYDDDNEDGARE